MESGSLCLDKLKGELPDIVFLDLQMPDMTGLEVLKHIRSNDKTAAMSVVMLSANSDSAVVNSDKEAKATCYIQKPFNMKEILALLEKL